MTLLHNSGIKKNYDILYTIEAGMILYGHEVKALRNKMGSMRGSFCKIKQGDFVISKLFIPAYQEKNTPPDYDSYRERVLLVNKKELLRLRASIMQVGLTIIPLRVYNKNKRIKVECAIARGLKKQDKRNILKNKAAQKDIRSSFT